MHYVEHAGVLTRLHELVFSEVRKDDFEWLIRRPELVGYAEVREHLQY